MRGMLVKRTFDLTVAALALGLFAPLLALLALAVRVRLGKPVLFAQARPGLHGAPFRLLKFRTMTDGRDASGQLLPDQVRLTPFGAFLRRTSLDELPELINVLKGEMSLVGPRPPIPSEVDQYDLWHRRRLSMKPGMTCLWQTARNRNGVRFEDWMTLDLQYIDNWSLKLDFVILLKTVGVVVSGEGR